MRISKAKAFIEIAEAVNAGNQSKADKMLNILGRSIARDRRNNENSADITLHKDEKALFRSSITESTH